MAVVAIAEIKKLMFISVESALDYVKPLPYKMNKRGPDLNLKVNIIQPLSRKEHSLSVCKVDCCQVNKKEDWGCRDVI